MSDTRLSPAIVALIHHTELNRSGWFEAYKKRAISTLFWLEHTDLSPQDVIDKQTYVGLTGLSALETSAFLSELCDEDVLIKINDDQYRLTETSFHEVGTLISSAETLEQTVIAQFCKIVERDFDNVSFPNTTHLWTKFHEEFLLPLVEFFGARTYEILTGTTTDIDQAPFAQQFLSTFSSDVRPYVRRIIEEFLDPSNLEFRAYTLRLLNNNFFLIANRYRREHLETLYGGAKRPVIRCLLDTNFLYSILELHDNPSNDAANALLTTIEKAKKYIDVRLYVFPPTVDELKRSLIAHEEFLSQLVVSKSLHAAVSDGAVSGVVLKFFTESARTGYTLSVKDYLDPYHNNLTQILRGKGIELFNEKTDHYADDQRTIDDALDQQSFLTQRHLNRNMRGRPKSYEQIWHDVLLWYFISDKRPAQFESVIDADVLGITIDYSLIGFDSYKRRGNIPGTPVFVHPATLIQLFQFFVPLDEAFESAILDTLRMPFLLQEFDPESERTTVRILARMSRFENIDDLSPETIRRILEDEMLRGKLENTENAEMDVRLIREALIAENAAAQRSLDEAKLKEQQFARKIGQLEGLTYQDKKEIINLKSEVKTRDQINSDLRDHLYQLTQEVNLIKHKDQRNKITRSFVGQYLMIPAVLATVLLVILAAGFRWERHDITISSLPAFCVVVVWLYVVCWAGSRIKEISGKGWFIILCRWKYRLGGLMVGVGLGLYVQLYWDLLLILVSN